MEKETKINFKEAIEKGLKAIKVLEDNKEFVKYHLGQLKEALESVFKDEFYISEKEENGNDLISLFVNTYNKDETYAIAQIFFYGSDFEKFNSDFKISDFNAGRDNLVPYLKSILERNHNFYWKLTSKEKT